MFLTLDIENFNESNILLNDPVKNILRSGCEFIKIIYSDKNIILNGVYIKIILNDVEIIKKKADIYKLKIDRDVNMEIIRALILIEQNILSMVDECLIKVYSLKIELLKLKLMKLHGQINLNGGNYSKMEFIIRIFGIWNDKVRCGLNYQLIPKTDKYFIKK
jgi:hypothetical protein